MKFSLLLTAAVTLLANNAFALGAEDDSVKTNKNQSVSFDVLTNDSKDDETFVKEYTTPSLGELKWENDQFTYVPQAGETGQVTFQYTISTTTVDAVISPETATVTLNVCLPEAQRERVEDNLRDLINEINRSVVSGDFSNVSGDLFDTANELPECLSDEIRQQLLDAIEQIQEQLEEAIDQYEQSQQDDSSSSSSSTPSSSSPSDSSGGQGGGQGQTIGQLFKQCLQSALTGLTQGGMANKVVMGTATAAQKMQGKPPPKDPMEAIIQCLIGSAMQAAMGGGGQSGSGGQ